MSLMRPSTPTKPISKPQSTSTPITGTWRHPQFDEIARRQNAGSFTDRNVKKILWNGAGIITTWVAGKLLWTALPSVFEVGTTIGTYASYTYFGLLLFLLGNIGLACWPLLRAEDDISDIPLTPAQRKLLGLAPTSKPPTPGSQYATPPRYARTPTPSGSPSSRAGSPLSGSPINANRSNSPFSPGATQYLQKAVGSTGYDGLRRQSFGSSSSLGLTNPKLNLQDLPGTPSPAAPKGASVGLNNRWLYEKGRRSSGNTRLFA